MIRHDNTAKKVDAGIDGNNDFVKKDNDFESEFQSPYPELEGDDLNTDTDTDVASGQGPVLIAVNSTDSSIDDDVLRFDEQDEQDEQELLDEVELAPDADDKAQLTPRSSKTNRVVTSLAFVFGSIALGLSVHSYVQNASQENYLLAVSTTLEELVGFDAELSSQMSTLEQTSQDGLAEVVNRQRDELSRMSLALETEMMHQRASFDDQTQLSSQQKADLTLLQVSVTDVQQKIDLLNSDLQNTASTLENIRTIARPIAAPSINFANSLEGATLESIDRWGNEVFVNLRTTNGNWMSFTDRDQFKGWAIVNIKEFEVTFSKGGQNKVLKLRD